MARDPRYVNSSKTVAMHVFPGLVVQVFNGAVTRDHLEAAIPMLDHPILGERYVELTHVAPKALNEIPDDAFRKLAAQTLKEKQSGKLIALAFVVGGEGFFASMARTVIAGVSLLVRPSYAEKVFSEPLPATTWLSTHAPPGTLGPEAMARSLDELLIVLTR